MNDKKERIRINNLYKIFGPNPERAFEYLDQGLSKAEVFEKTGLTVGVQNASFSVYDGEIFVVMGLSGSGKSTLIRMVNRLIEPTRGEVLVEGTDVTKMSQEELIKLRRSNMSMVFQSFALFPHLTVLQNAAFGLEITGASQKQREDRAMEALEQVGLKANAHSYPGELSGGMQQRVGLARGLAVDPSIMLMDEAFSALDPLIRTEMQDQLLKIQEHTPRTVLFISHDLDEAMRIGDRIAMMEGGRIVQVGSPEEILKNPADEYVKAFFRGVDPTNVLSARDIMRNNYPTIILRKSGGPRSALELLLDKDRDFGYVLDSQKRYQGVVSIDSLKSALEKGDDIKMEQAFLEDCRPVNSESSMQEILPVVTESSCPVPVLDEEKVYLGAISKNIFLKTLHRSAD